MAILGQHVGGSPSQLFLAGFGPEWFETGSVSVHFVNPVSHLVPVKAFMSKPKPKSGVQAESCDIWMEFEDGRVVFEVPLSPVHFPLPSPPPRVPRALRAARARARRRHILLAWRRCWRHPSEVAPQG